MGKKGGPPTSDSAEGVDVFGGEQGRGQFPDELLEQGSSIVWIHLLPAELPRVKTGLQLLLQQLQSQNGEMEGNKRNQKVSIHSAKSPF